MRLVDLVQRLAEVLDVDQFGEIDRGLPSEEGVNRATELLREEMHRLDQVLSQHPKYPFRG
jgi:hypothetical protein